MNTKIKALVPAVAAAMMMLAGGVFAGGLTPAGDGSARDQQFERSDDASRPEAGRSGPNIIGEAVPSSRSEAARAPSERGVPRAGPRAEPREAPQAQEDDPASGADAGRGGPNVVGEPAAVSPGAGRPGMPNPGVRPRDGRGSRLIEV